MGAAWCAAAAVWVQLGALVHLRLVGAAAPARAPAVAFAALAQHQNTVRAPAVAFAALAQHPRGRAHAGRRAASPGRRAGAGRRRIAVPVGLRCTSGSTGNAGAGGGAAGGADDRRERLIDELLAEVWAGNDGHCSSEAEDAQIDQIAGEL